MDTSSAAQPARPAPGAPARTPGARGQDVVVIPLRGERVCARPSCRSLATATLTFSYAERFVELTTLREVPVPQTYDLCQTHA
ncbi:MAG: DUF3499 family protein, partial [Nitriliruptoraceae bacterium]